jgi:hypothetical protein
MEARGSDRRGGAHPRTPVAAGALTGVLAGAVMAVLASSGGGLVASVPAIILLTALLVVAGVVYGWLVQTDRLRAAFGPGILYWSGAFATARLLFELWLGDPSSRAGLSNGLMGFLAFQVMVGAGFGLGFVLVHNQVSTLLGKLSPRRE